MLSSVYSRQTSIYFLSMIFSNLLSQYFSSYICASIFLRLLCAIFTNLRLGSHSVPLATLDLNYSINNHTLMLADNYMHSCIDFL